MKIEGGREAKIFEAWLGFIQGCNPRARLSGNILEDERVWGVVEWSIGYQSPTFKGKVGHASSHTDGICFYPTVVGDGEKVIERGEFIHPELVDLAKKLKSGSKG